MIRLSAVCIVCLIIIVADGSGYYAVAMAAGILAGAAYFVIGASKGGMRPIGLAAPHLMKDIPKHPSDPNSGIGCALAASGIASSAVANLHYPYAWRFFYGFCIAAGIVIAIGWSWRNRMNRAEPTDLDGKN